MDSNLESLELPSYSSMLYNIIQTFLQVHLKELYHSNFAVT